MRFPGEGRGPVAKVFVTARSVSVKTLRRWAPAFAGEDVVPETPDMQTPGPLPTRAPA
jgi:hypothetical protein